MALFDHRTFDSGGKWWAAEVHGGSGVGTGYVPHITREMVLFTCLSDSKLPTRVAHIPAGWLNTIGHNAIIRVLNTAKAWGHRVEMSGYNSPDADEYMSNMKFEDEDGLAWGARRVESVVVLSTGPAIKHAVELVCFDDSALKGRVPFANGETLDDFLTIHGVSGLKELTKLVKATLRDDYTPEDEDEDEE